MMLGEAPCTAARDYGRQELNADGTPNDQIAEAQLVVQEVRDDRERQASGEIAAKERRNDARLGARKVNWRSIRPVHTFECEFQQGNLRQFR